MKQILNFKKIFYFFSLLFVLFFTILLFIYYLINNDYFNLSKKLILNKNYIIKKIAKRIYKDIKKSNSENIIMNIDYNKNIIIYKIFFKNKFNVNINLNKIKNKNIILSIKCESIPFKYFFNKLKGKIIYDIYYQSLSNNMYKEINKIIINKCK